MRDWNWSIQLKFNFWKSIFYALLLTFTGKDSDARLGSSFSLNNNGMKKATKRFQHLENNQFGMISMFELGALSFRLIHSVLFVVLLWKCLHFLASRAAPESRSCNNEAFLLDTKKRIQKYGGNIECDGTSIRQQAVDLNRWLVFSSTLKWGQTIFRTREKKRYSLWKESTLSLRASFPVVDNIHLSVHSHPSNAADDCQSKSKNQHSTDAVFMQRH